MIKLENISKIYPTKNGPLTALNDINLTVGKGEVFGVIGKSGAGKSTLIRCVNLLDNPSSGKVIIDGDDLTNMSAKHLRQARHKIGMIFQHFNLLSSRSVYQNIALPLKLIGTDSFVIDKKVNHLLEIVELTDKKHTYPSQLSGGQKQRVAIARAIACDPKVLLCDEATSALDPKTTESILALLQKINRELNLTILLITHEMSVIKQVCSRVAVIDKAHIIEQSTIVELFTQPQSDITKALIQRAIRPALPEKIANKLLPQPTNSDYPVIQITFYGDAADKPIIANLITRLGIQVNILQANVDYLRETVFGVMVIELIANPTQCEQAFDYLQQANLPVEVLGYVASPAE